MKANPPRYWQTAMLVLVVVGLIFLSVGGYLKPALSTASNPFVSIQQWISTRYMAVYEFLTVPRDVASLRQRNAELEDQVSNLQTQVIQLEQQLREADVLYALLGFARSRPQNEYVASSVIGRDPSPFLRYIYIDHGSDDGLRHGMPVVTEQGLVGRVDAVTANGARVQLITDPGSSVNVRLQSLQVDAIVTGSVTGDITLGFVPQDVVLQPGDLILTSGLGGVYPTDIVLGQVISVRKLETELFQTASVQPVVDFSTLRAVLVITNFRPMNVAPLIPTPIP
jgi:rod shape-determining protein MreC